MIKQLAGFFSFVLALVLVAAVMTVTAQPDAETEALRAQREFNAWRQQVDGDIAFLMRAFEKAGLIEERK